MRIRREALIAVVAALVTLTSTILTYAVLINTVTLTDTVSITHRTPSPRTAVEDTLELDDEAGDNNKLIEEELLPEDSTSLLTDAKDDLSPSDSALAVSSSYHLVSVATDFDLLDSTAPGVLVSDQSIIRDKIGNYANAAADVISMLDSIGRAFFVTVAESLSLTESSDSQQAAPVEDEDEQGDTDTGNGGGGGGASNLAYDESYFLKNPLMRFQVRSYGLTDSDGSAFSEARQGEPIRITASFRNYQKLNQSYTMIVQVEDGQSGFTKEILYSNGSLGRAKTASATLSWSPEDIGTCKLKLMIWSELEDGPIPLADPVSKSLKVADSRSPP